MTRRRWARAIAYGRLPHSLPVVAVLAATTGMTLVIERGMPGGGQFAAILLGMLGSQILIGVVNELVDAPLDRATKPEKPLASGLVSERGAFVMLGSGGVLALAGGLWTGLASLALLAVGTALGVGYSLVFKRTSLAWLPYVLALPLLPIWVAVALERFDVALLGLYPLGAVMVIGVYLAQSAPDIAADRLAGLRTVPTRLGQTATIVAVWAAIGVTAVGVILTAWLLDRLTGALVIVAAVALVAIGVNIAWYIRNEDRGVLLAFPVAAGSAVALGLGWVSAFTG